MKPILRLIIVLINFTLSYFLVREVIDNVTVNQYIIITVVIVFTVVFSIFTTGGVKIERNIKVEENQQENLNE